MRAPEGSGPFAFTRAGGGCSAPEHARRHPQPRGGSGPPLDCLLLGDLAGDLAQLGGDRRLARRDPFEAVEDLVMLTAARRQHRDDVLHRSAADVGDICLDACVA